MPCYDIYDMVHDMDYVVLLTFSIRVVPTYECPMGSLPAFTDL